MLDIADLEHLDANEYESSDALLKAKAEHQAMLAMFENRKKLRSIAVPTDDLKVRVKLREFQEPITLFGEGPAERRDRLRLLLLKQKEHEHFNEEEENVFEDENEERLEKKEEEMDQEKEAIEEEYWTPGPETLLDARLFITNYSLRRAQQRIAIQRKEFDTSLNYFKYIRKELYADLQTYTHYCSQLVDDRPTSFVSFSPNSQYLATGSFSGQLKLWNVPEATLITHKKAHEDRIGGLAWHPQSTLSLTSSNCHLASGSSDGSIGLWSLTLNNLAKLQGHTARVSRVAFHPSGRFVGSASFDSTWKLWDVHTQQCLLTQDGHAMEVYCLAFHLDGSLLCSGGLDGMVKVWDLRTGKLALNFLGHLKQVLALDMAPFGYQVVSGSQDNTLRIWDLRSTQCMYTIPAHTSLVSQVKYYLHTPSSFASSTSTDNTMQQEEEKKDFVDGYFDVYSSLNHQDLTPSVLPYQRGHPITSGMYLVSSGFDGKIHLWGEGDFKLIKTLQGHEGKVMSMDISSDSKFIASAGYDRTFKLWTSHQLQL